VEQCPTQEKIHSSYQRKVIPLKGRSADWKQVSKGKGWK
jgi:hypothetical protein